MMKSTTIMARSISQDSRHEYPNSDTKLERTHLSDAQYIEQLLFENKELKALVDRQKKIIEKLNNQLKSSNEPEPEPEPELQTSTATEVCFKRVSAALSPTLVTIPKSPQRSISNHSMQLSPTRQILSVQRQENMADATSSDPVTQDIPLRSSRRRRNSNESKSLDKKASYISLESSTTPLQIPNSMSNESTSSSSYQTNGNGRANEYASIKSPDFEVDLGNITSKSDTINNTFDSKMGMDTTIGTVDSIDSGKINETVESQFSTMESTKSQLDISGSSTATGTGTGSSTLGAAASSSSTGVSKIYSQSKGIARSSSSVGSTYKSSRIKPPNLQTKPSNSSTVDLAPPTSLKTAASNISSSVEQKSPSLQYDTSPQIQSDTNIKSQLAPPYEMSKSNNEQAPPVPPPKPNSKPTLNLSNQSSRSTGDSNQFATSYDGPATPRPTIQTPNTSSFNVNSAPQTPGSSFNVLHTPKTDMDESSLFIKPDEFHTIFISVISTIHVDLMNQTSKKSDDPNVTITINDRETNKEMWKIRKTFSQLVIFDSEIRPIVEYFGLPPLPDKQLFVSSTPAKIETRRLALQNYFNSIFVMPHIPRMVLYYIYDFKSGARKEGFLVRRYKGLGATWKIRWCQVDGPYMEIYENPGGSILEQIQLTGAQIGRQSSDAVAEDKGYRHAFLIMESSKSSKLHSSVPKHFFCAESNEERDDWVTALIEFTEDASESIENSPQQPQYHQQQQYDRSSAYDSLSTPSTRYDHTNDDLKPNSSNIFATPASIAASVADSLSTYTMGVVGGEDQSQKQKPKKRSYFPFRTKTNSSNDEPEDQHSQHSHPDNNNHLSLPNTGMINSQNTYTQQQYQQQYQPSGYPNGHQQQQQPSSSGFSGSEDNMQQYLSQMKLDEDSAKKIFGSELEIAFELSNHEFMGRKIPKGIFRLSGSASSIRQLKDQFNTRYDVDLFQSSLKPDIHTVSGLFKSYLRKFSHNTYQQQQQATGIFLRQIIQQSDINRMTLKNVGIIFEPTLNINVEVLCIFLVEFDTIFGV
ncbi:RhoGAP domain family protein [Candida albicans]|uniref:RhoGAP domain family protein n=1 Tax=Candida albicans TaxID=5476 RepID=A0A8H6C0W8_CANAX|nr:RhoGAP domain family protein [Candida albicans]